MERIRLVNPEAHESIALDGAEVEWINDEEGRLRYFCTSPEHLEDVRRFRDGKQLVIQTMADSARVVVADDDGHLVDLPGEVTARVMRIPPSAHVSGPAVPMTAEIAAAHHEFWERLPTEFPDLKSPALMSAGGRFHLILGDLLPAAERDRIVDFARQLRLPLDVRLETGPGESEPM